MIEEKENLKEAEESGSDEVIDTPIELTPEAVEKVKEAIAEEVREEANISDKDSELFKQMCKEATMPVEYLDKDFKLGENELDIRKLTKKNLIQMFFRTQVLNNVYLKNIQNSLIDITRLLMIHLDKIGVENIVKATDDIIDKIREQNEELKEVLKKGN